jgi:type IV pilus assembly protein PilB
MVPAKLGQPVSRRLGDLLVAEGLISDHELAQAMAAQKGSSERLGSILVRLRLIREEQLTGFLSRQYGVPSVSLAHLDVDPDVLRLVPAGIARKHEVLPLKRVGDSLTVAMADPANVFAVDDIAFMTNLQVLPVVAPQAAIRAAIGRVYDTGAGQSAGDVASALSDEGAEVIARPEALGTVDVVELQESADEPPVVKLVNTVLMDAVQKRASDIHWEPYEKVFRVRVRVDGVLHEMQTPPKRLEPAIISRLKIMSNLDIAERRLPQDGRMKFRYGGREVDFRVSILPTIFGEKAVLRILDRDALKLDLTTLGFDAWSLETFRAAIHQPHGLVLITGPTGSGKTTTLYSAIHTINTPRHNIVTAEDPVEYNLKGVNQVQIHEAVGRTFAGALRSFLRQDPDVILVGETRDLETAQISVRAALTGHLVFSTLHTNDCASTVARLVDMGIPPFLLSSSLLLIVAQRLVRTVCAQCREPDEIDESALAVHGHVTTGAGRITVFRGAGCEACGFTGMHGRVALYEVMPVGADVRELILRAAPPADLRRAAQEQGMKTLRQAGIMKVMEGVTTVEEVLRVTLA